MRSKIGEEAGRIWQLLGDKEEIEVSILPRTLKEKGEVIYQALGWLAHEDKVVYKSKGSKIYVALNDRERGIYLQANSVRQDPKKLTGRQTVRT